MQSNSFRQMDKPPEENRTFRANKTQVLAILRHPQQISFSAIIVTVPASNLPNNTSQPTASSAAACYKHAWHVSNSQAHTLHSQQKRTQPTHPVRGIRRGLLFSDLSLTKHILDLQNQVSTTLVLILAVIQWSRK